VKIGLGAAAAGVDWPMGCPRERLGAVKLKPEGPDAPAPLNRPLGLATTDSAIVVAWNKDRETLERVV
jgi:hypothetical protein